MHPSTINLFRKVGIKSKDLKDKILNKIIIKTIVDSKSNYGNIPISINSY